MTTYTNIFGGTTVQTADVSYLSIALSQNTTLSWPTQFQDTNLVVAHILDVVPTGNGFNLTLPDATQTSVGQDILINNPSAFTFTLKANDGTNLLSPVPAGSSNYFYLIDNTTQAGTWRNVPFGTGGAVVTSIAATSGSTALTITGSPITNAGTLAFNIVGDLASINALGSTGLGVRTAAQTWAVRTIIGSTNITVNNGDGVAGNPQIVLNNSLTNLTQVTIGNITIGFPNAQTITTTAGNLELFASGTNPIQLLSSTWMVGDGVNARPILFFNGANTFATGLIAGANTSTVVFTLPIADGVANALMKTDGGQNLGFTSQYTTSKGILQSFISFTGIGAATVVTSYNATVARVTGGTYTVTFPGGMFSSGTSYIWNITAGQGAAGTGGFIVNAPSTGTTPTSTTFTFTVNTTAGTPTDAEFVSAMFIGT
jgi:hypothetical protein